MTPAFAKTSLKIKLDNVKQNFVTLQKQISAATIIGAVVKADGYGLGAVAIARALAKVHCAIFFTTSVDEAVPLRENLPQGTKIYILHGISSPSMAAACVEYNLVPVLNSPSQLHIWNSLGSQLERPLDAILHIDSGLSRLGISESELHSLIDAKERMSYIRLEYIMSHLACAEQKDNPRNQQQLQLVKQYKSLFPDIKITLANSSGIFLGPEYQFDLVRPGCALYGINPTPHCENPMLPVATLQGYILQKRILEREQYVGYGMTHAAPAGTKLFIVESGYADGYSRQLSNKGFCYASGYHLPVVGLVSMDAVIFDASTLPDIIFNSLEYVELLGENIKIDDIAKYTNTISYEILTTKFGRRYQRIYIEKDNITERA